MAKCPKSCPICYRGGFGLSDVANFIGFKTRDNYSPSVRKFIRQQGSEIIESMAVGRQPISKFIDVLLNVVSLGNFKKNMKKYYDKMFHLYLIFKTKNGTYKIEKNEVIAISTYNPSKEDLVPVQLHGPISVEIMLDRARAAVGPSIFHYNPVNNNCQVFIHNLLKYSNLLTDELDSFIMQDAAAVLTDGSFERKFAIDLTNLRERLDTIISGRGL